MLASDDGVTIQQQRNNQLRQADLLPSQGFLAPMGP